MESTSLLGARLIALPRFFRGTCDSPPSRSAREHPARRLFSVQHLKSQLAVVASGVTGEVGPLGIPVIPMS